MQTKWWTNMELKQLKLPPSLAMQVTAPDLDLCTASYLYSILSTLGIIKWWQSNFTQNRI